MYHIIMSKYSNAISNILNNNTIISDKNICEIIALFSSNKLKHYLRCKYDDFFISNRLLTYPHKHHFTYNDMSLYFKNITKKINKRHPLIHFEKEENIISLYKGTRYKITFNIIDNELYLYPNNEDSPEWVYSEPSTLFDLWLNSIFIEEPKKLLPNDILFENC